MRESAALKNFAVVCLLGAAFQLGIVAWLCADFDARVPRLLPDDAMYYLKIAQNIAAGSGSVFSAGEPTNGYHPLWMLPLVCIARIAAPAPETFAALTLILGVLCNGGASWFLRRLLLQLGCGEGTALFGVAAYWTLPWAVHLTLTGLETPLYLLCLLAFVSSYHRVACDSAAGRGAWIGLGVWAGLLMLSRTDGVLFTAPLFVALLWRRGVRVLPALSGSAALAAVLVAPWLVWNLARFGTVMQSSGIAMSFLGHAYAPPLSEPLAYLQHGVDHALTILCRSVAQPFLATPAFDPAATEPPFLDPGFGGRAATVIGLLALVGVAIWRRLAGRGALLPAALSWPGLGVAFVYLFVRMYAQVWHLSCFVPLAVIGVARLVDRPTVRFTAVATFIAASGFALQYGYFSPQRDFITAARSLRADAPAALRIGITDSGYAGVFSRHEIVNLDGVVNNAVLRSILDGRISEYLTARDFDEVRIQKWRMPIYDRNTPLGQGSYLWRQARFVDYAPGTRIQFASRDADGFLLLGWSAAEAEYRWTDGDLAWIGFGLQQPQALVLTLAAHALGGQQVGVEVNGQHLATLEFPATGVAERSVPIAAALLQRRNGLVFRLTQARSPRSMGLGLDGRRLGIAVRWLSLNP